MAEAVDILINNAAPFPMGPTVPPHAHIEGTDGPLSADAEAFETASVDAAFAANVRAPYQLAAAFAPAMVAKGSASR